MQTILRRAYKIGVYTLLAAFSFVLSSVIGNNRIGGIEKGTAGFFSGTPEAYADVVGSVGSGEGSGSAAGCGEGGEGGGDGGGEGGGSSSCSSE